jgi:hypothetical protein
VRAVIGEEADQAGRDADWFHPERIEKPKFSVVRIRLEGANPNSTASGVDTLPGRSNYFIGKDRAKWRTGIATYGGVRFESIYPGINLIYRGTQGRLEYDFVIAPNGDPSRIKMNIEGADALSLDGAGNLAIKTAGGEVIQKAPAIYQESQGTRHPIAGGYALMGKHSVTFKLGAYDRSAALIIDPLLTYVSYLGGSDDAFGYGIGVDSEGDAIVVGTTLSTDFPVVGAFQPNLFGGFDAFITKVNPDGTELIYSTYAGGSNSDAASAVGIDSKGNAYVTGSTQSADFPVTVGAFQTTFTGSPTSAFVIGLNSDGGLIYSTFLDGPGFSDGGAVAVSSSGNAYVTGETDGVNLCDSSDRKLSGSGAGFGERLFRQCLRDRPNPWFQLSDYAGCISTFLRRRFPRGFRCSDRPRAYGGAAHQYADADLNLNSDTYYNPNRSLHYASDSAAHCDSAAHFDLGKRDHDSGLNPDHRAERRSHRDIDRDGYHHAEANRDGDAGRQRHLFAEK